MEVVNKLRCLFLEFKDLRNKSKIVLSEAKTLLVSTKNYICEDKVLAYLEDIEKVPDISLEKVQLLFEKYQIKQNEKADCQNERVSGLADYYGQLVATNTLIMSNVFNFLNFEDLKSCRQTCRIWEETSEGLFLKKAKPLISSHSRNAEEFLHYFENVSMLKFSDISFNNCHCLSSVLTDIFVKHLNLLTSLTLDNISLSNEDGKLEWFDLSPLIGENLKTLAVNTNASLKTTRMIVSDKNLVSIEHITLKFCKLVLCEGARKICAKEYHFRSVIVCSDTLIGEKLLKASVNSLNWINFYEFLYNARQSTHGFKLSLHLKMDELCEQMETLHLSYWDFGNHLLTKNTILKHLTISGIISRFQWSCLPRTLETLSFDFRLYDVPTLFLNPPVDFLPNLKVLNCRFIEEIPWLPHFSGCDKLTKVTIQSRFATTHCDLNWLPLSVKELHLERVIAYVPEGFQRQLQSLSLVGYPPSSIIPLLSKFKTENLLLMNELSCWDYEMHVCIHISHLPLKTFVIGKFQWKDEWEFKNSPFAHCVDKIMSKYYMFKKGIGKGIQIQRNGCQNGWKII